jgi:hypothetical protein
MGRSQRRKGHDFERLIVRWLRKLDPTLFPERNLTETRTGNTGDVFAMWRSPWQSLHRLTIQAKNRKSPSVWKAMDEARATTTSPSDLPIAIVKRTGDQTVVCMDTETFAYLLTGTREAL